MTKTVLPSLDQVVGPIGPFKKISFSRRLRLIQHLHDKPVNNNTVFHIYFLFHMYMSLVPICILMYRFINAHAFEN